MKSKRLKEYEWLIFGGGAVVTEYYLPAFEFMEILDNITVIEPNPISISKIKEKWPVRIVQKSYQDFFIDFKLQSEKTIAVVTLPNFLHVDAVKKCFDQKINVLCEKPLALKSSEIDELIELEYKTGCKLAVGMVRRYLPTFSTLKKIIESQKYGKVISVEISYGSPFGWVADSYSFFDPKNGGVFADMGIHYLDLVLFLFGPITPSSYHDDWQGGVEANSKIGLETENEKIPVSISLSRTKKLKNQFKVTTSECIISIGSDTFDKLEISVNNNNYFLTPSSPFTYSNELPLIFESAFVEQLWNFISFCDGDSEAQVVSSLTGKSGVEIIEWAYNHHVSELIPTNETQNYYITGGTGFIGSALIKNIYQNNLGKVTAPVHRYKSCASIGIFPISMPRLNLFDEEQLFLQIKGHKHVIHLAYDSSGGDDYKINVIGTQNIVKASIRAGVESIVVLSSMYVYGHPNTNEFVDETWPLNPTGGDYGKSKAQMQKWCLEMAKTLKNTRLIVLNPSCVFGPEGKTYSRLPYELFLNGRFCWVDSGNGIANIVYIDNLIDAIMLAAKVKSAHGKNYIITDNSVDWKTFISPLLLGNEDKIQNITSEELMNPQIKNYSSTKEVISYLLNNYEFISLINRHAVFGKLKKTIFKLSGKLKKGLINKRNESTSKNPLKVRVENNSVFPIWLMELYGLTKTKFSAESAKKDLGWIPKINHEMAMEKTVEWLKEEFK